MYCIDIKNKFESVFNDFFKIVSIEVNWILFIKVIEVFIV